MSNAIKRLGAVLLTLALTGCVAAPDSSEALGENARIDRASEQGLARGSLSVIGSVREGSNDFELELTAVPPYELATLQEVVAVMPAHGHRGVPGRVEETDAGYRIVDLELTMSGAWQLRSELFIDEQADAISFEIDVP
jgi:hypothetical protein